MSTLPRLRHRPWIPAWACVGLALQSAPGVAVRAEGAWEACRDRAIADLEAAGLRDFGDVGAYTGATGSGALQTIIERCGYRSERIDRTWCDDLYRNVYPACPEDGFDGMSVSATSWVLVFRSRRPARRATPAGLRTVQAGQPGDVRASGVRRMTDVSRRPLPFRASNLVGCLRFLRARIASHSLPIAERPRAIAIIQRYCRPTVGPAPGYRGPSAEPETLTAGTGARCARLWIPCPPSSDLWRHHL